MECHTFVYRRGVIKECAEQRCGGAHNLEAAMERGDVSNDTNAQGIELYYFPEDTCSAATFAICTISSFMCAVSRSITSAALCYSIGFSIC